jgi:hypothetical protein
MVDGYEVVDWAPAFARLSTISLPGMLVWDGVHIVSRFQPLRRRSWARVSASRVNW